MAPRSEDKEALFLVAYYDPKSKTKGKKGESMLAAGYTESTAEAGGRANKIIRRFEGLSFQEAAKKFGITKPYLAARLRVILDLPADKHSKDVLAAAKMALTNFGENVDGASGVSGNVFNGPVMVIQGATPEKLRNLKEGLPQLTTAERQKEEDDRVWARIDKLKKGEGELAWHTRPHSKAKKHAAEKAVPGVDEHDGIGDQEAGTPEGRCTDREGAGDAPVLVDVPATRD